MAYNFPQKITERCAHRNKQATQEWEKHRLQKMQDSIQKKVKRRSRMMVGQTEPGMIQNIKRKNKERKTKTQKNSGAIYQSER